MTIKLSKQYKYIKEKLGEFIRIRLIAVPLSGQQAIKFYTETHKIANLLFNNGHSGGSLNSVCTAQFGAVIFQSSDSKKNLTRAKTVTRIWRNWKRYNVLKCTCRISLVLPDETIYFGNIDDCPVHGFG